MEQYAAETKGKEYKIIELAKKEQEKFNEDRHENDEQPIGRPRTDSLDFSHSKTSTKKKDTDEEELLYKDPLLDFKEYEDYLMINGEKLKKPFVEKPINAEDHEIKIYYSSQDSCGSGYNVLFRKTDNYSG